MSEKSGKRGIVVIKLDEKTSVFSYRSFPISNFCPPVKITLFSSIQVETPDSFSALEGHLRCPRKYSGCIVSRNII